VFAFIDESYRNEGSRSAVTTYAAVVVPRDHSRDLARGLWNLKRRAWPKDDPHDKELKGRILLAPKKLESGIYDDIIAGVLVLMRDQDATPFAVTRIGEMGSFKSKRNRFPVYLQWLLHRVNDYTALRAPNALAVPVLDTVEDKTNRTVSEAMSNFLFRSNFGQTFQHIVDFPTFGDSRTTPGVQLADIVAYTVCAYHDGRTGRLEDIYEEMKAMTHNWVCDGRVTDWGFRCKGRKT